MTQPRTYLTASDAAARLRQQGLQVHAETLKRWAREGRVPAFLTPSGQYRFLEGDVDAARLLQAVDAREDR